MAGIPFYTRADLTADLRELGLRRGDAVLTHGALRKVGPMIDGPDTLVGALLDAVSPGGTVLAYTDWDAPYMELLDVDGRCPRRWRRHVPPFDPDGSRAIRDNGAFPEFLRTRPGARRSGSPGASVAAVGARAEWFTADHPIDYGYGPGSPFAKLVETGGKVAMIGAPFDTMTLLHHAEHLADVESHGLVKNVVRYEVPFAGPDGTRWRPVEEYDTSLPMVGEEDTFARIVTEYVNTGAGRTGFVGKAVSLVVDAPDVCGFAVRWMEEWAREDGDDGDEDGDSDEADEQSHR